MSHIKMFETIMLCMMASLPIQVAHLYAQVEVRAEKGRFTVVAALKHKQFLDLYDFLLHHAQHFDPRYAGSLRTDGNPHDENKNLHITLASTDLGAHNEKACKNAVEAIEGILNNEIHVNFEPTKLSLDSDLHVKLPLKLDGGYHLLVSLQEVIVRLLRLQEATGIHAPNPNHVTIGFATKLPSSSYHGSVGFGRITHARVYHWVGHGEQKYPPREEFYPKKEVKIYH